MSDTTVSNAPPNPAQTSNTPPTNSPPVSHEVPIDQSPTHRPNPVGPQAPDRLPDVASERRAAIQRAFDKASNPPPKDAKPAQRATPPAADARPGHNQPPEETKPERLDLRKRPPADAAVPSVAQPRDRGRFAPRVDAIGNVPSPRAPGTQQQPGQQVRQLPATAPYAQPPQRMSERAKVDWHTTPESVRGEVGRMQEEFVKAYRVYKGDFEEMSKIRHFHKMATDQGTDLLTALTNYTGMEQKLRADPVAGLDVIVNNLNLRTPDGQKIGLRDIAYHVLSQSPDQLRQLQMGNQQQAASQQIGALHAEIQGLRQTVHQMHNQQQFNYTRSAIDVFADSHPRFDELGTAVERELKLGFPLDEAYRRAELLHPTTQAPQTRTQSAQTREPDRSIHGSLDGGPSNGTSRRPRTPSPTPRAAVANAMARLNGQI